MRRGTLSLASLASTSLIACATPSPDLRPGRPPVDLLAPSACPGDIEIRARAAFAALAEQAALAGLARVGVASLMREDAGGNLQLDWEDACRARLLDLAAEALADRRLLPPDEQPTARALNGVVNEAHASRTDQLLLANAFSHDALYDVARLPQILALTGDEPLDGVMLGRYETSGEMLIFAVLVNRRGEFIAPAESTTVEITPQDVLALTLIVDSSGSMKDNDPHAFRSEGARHIARTIALAREPTVLLGFVGFDSELRWTFAPARVWQPGSGEKPSDAPPGALESFTRIIAAIDQIDNGAQTNMKAPLEWALEHLGKLTEIDGRPVTRRDVFLLTDGVHNEPDDTWKPSFIAPALAEAGIHVWAVGLGAGAQKDELSKLAKLTGGRFFDLANERAMAEFLAIYLATYQPLWRFATQDGAQNR